MTALQAMFEHQLVSHSQAMEAALFGLTTVDVRKLAENIGINQKLNNSEIATLVLTGYEALCHSTLNWQTREQLEQGAREALQIITLV